MKLLLKFKKWKTFDIIPQISALIFIFTRKICNKVQHFKVKLLANLTLMTFSNWNHNLASFKRYATTDYIRSLQLLTSYFLSPQRLTAQFDVAKISTSKRWPDFSIFLSFSYIFSYTLLYKNSYNKMCRFENYFRTALVGN